MNNFSINEYPWHQSSWDKIVSARAKDHLPHALLLSGDEGIGKLDFAEKVIRSLLCTSPIKSKACQTCQSCKTYLSGANPDFLRVELLEGKQQISVDQVRKISEFINYTRSFNAYRVVLVNPAERMNQNSANSLLKSLEEPASNTVIILLASSLGRILPTIKSRCQLITIPKPDKDAAIAWLKEQKPDEADPEKLLDMAYGQPLTALNIDEEEIQNKDDFVNELLAVCLQQKTVTEIAKKWEKFDQATLLNWQIAWVQNFIKENVTEPSMGEATADASNQTLSKLKSSITDAKQWTLYQQLITQKQYIHTSVNALLFIENLLLLWLQASQID